MTTDRPEETGPGAPSTGSAPSAASAQPWPTSPVHRRWLEDELLRLLRFGRRVALPGGGAAVLDDRGVPLASEPVHLWITARMVHVHALATLLGVPGARDVADAVAVGLRDRLVDVEHGGWFSAVDVGGEPGVPRGAGDKSCYDHAFVLLAASSAHLARLDGAEELLERAQHTFLTRFWDDEAGMVVDSRSRDWSVVDPYRGLNSSMHAVEAMLAAADATGDGAWLARAHRTASRVAVLAGEHEHRLPEHFDEAWTPLLEHHADRPADPFKPYGATIGHGLEWSRLLLQLDDAPLVETAVALFDRAVADGWSVDGRPGFVYTTDWHGAPVVRARMHWVLAEATAAAHALWRRTGETRFADLYARWWDEAERHFVDRDAGSWHHELDTSNKPAHGTWAGKPDLYHAVQATLLPRLPVGPSIAGALAAGLLDT